MGCQSALFTDGCSHPVKSRNECTSGGERTLDWMHFRWNNVYLLALMGSSPVARECVGSGEHYANLNKSTPPRARKEPACLSRWPTHGGWHKILMPSHTHREQWLPPPPPTPPPPWHLSQLAVSCLTRPAPLGLKTAGLASPDQR